MKRLLLGTVCLAAAAGCDDASSTADTPVAPVRQGDIGAVTFTYACAGPGDAQCNVDSDLAPVAKDSAFPPIGAGTKFVVQTKWNDADQGPLTASGAGSTFFTLDTTAPSGALVTTLKDGRGALLAYLGSQVVDLTTIEVRAFDHIKVLQASPAGDFKNGSIDIDLSKGTASANANVQFTFKFRAVPADKDDTILVGQLPVQWASLNADVVKLTSAPDDNVATFVSGASGKATVHVTVGGKAADITVQVGS